MSISEKIFDGLQRLQDYKFRNYRFVGVEDDFLNCWVIKSDNIGGGSAYQALIRPELFKIETLKSKNIWDEITVSRQKSIELGLESIQEERSERMEHARRGRKSKVAYAHIPREIRCSCAHVDDIAPGVFVKKAGLFCQDTELERTKIQKFIDDYKCSVCVPRRKGRARNPLYANIPRSVKCSGKDCGKECTITSKVVYELTGGDKEKIEKYCKEYLCRKCNPEWGSWLKGKRGGRGRKPNPENVGFPKEATCVGCSRKVKITPNNIRDKAKRMGITVEVLVSTYKCQKCGGRMKRKS